MEDGALSRLRTSTLFYGIHFSDAISKQDIIRDDVPDFLSKDIIAICFSETLRRRHDALALGMQSAQNSDGRSSPDAPFVQNVLEWQIRKALVAVCLVDRSKFPPSDI